MRARVFSGGSAVPAAVVRAGRIGALTDAEGLAILRVSPGPTTLTVMRIGFVPDSLTIVLTAGSDTTLDFELTPLPSNLTTVIVTSTRAERRLEDEPLRVEVLAGEDVSEKTEMRPADLRTIFREMSGVRVQNTSPSLGASSVRVQGLKGAYVAMLNDGLPLYGGHPGGFSLVQQPPLDLRQVEVIKGAASALYGPSALGGVVNLISRHTPDTSQLLVNQTSAGGTDLIGFVAHSMSPEAGVTALAGAHNQQPFDGDGDGWSDIVGFRRAELRPRFFYQDGNGRSLMVTAGGFAEDRAGGPMTARSSLASDADSLITRHADVGAIGRVRLAESWTLSSRTSASVEMRRRLFSGTRERERHETLFGEVSATRFSTRNTFLAGLAWQRDAYRNTEVPRFDDALITPSAFAQHTFSPVEWLSSTLNGRCDDSNRYGTICTPRVSLLMRRGSGLSLRGSVGRGWFAPTALNEDTEVIGLSRVSIPTPLAAERARTASVDVTATRGALQVNGTLFANRIARPVGLRPVAGDPAGAVEMINAPGSLRSSGAELFAVYNREPVIATVYYTRTRSRQNSLTDGSDENVPLTPGHEAGMDFALEEDEAGAYLAVEVFYTSSQTLEDNPYRSISPSYTTLGLLGSKRFGHVTIFLNAENLTNVRQSHFDPIVRPTPGPGGRRAVGAWAPLEGRTANAGIRYAF